MMVRAVLYCLLGGLPFILAGLGAGHVGWWWLSGVVLAAACAAVAIYGPRGVVAQFGVIAPALFVTSVFCTWTEAVVFMPATRARAVGDLVGGTIMYLIVAATLALLAWALRLNRPADPTAVHQLQPQHQRSALGAVAVVVGAGFAYAVYYLIFGSITYQFFTRGFYPDAPQQVAALGVWFWPMEIGRGILMAAALFPMASTLRMERWHAAIAVGAFCWVAGGLAPLLVPNDLMGGTQRLIHIVEILTQNASLGITLVLLNSRSGMMPACAAG